MKRWGLCRSSLVKLAQGGREKKTKQERVKKERKGVKK
jgi:hypothetical protein